MSVLQNLQKPFEVETYASGYAMKTILMQGGRYVCYHSEVFHGVVLNYPTYDKEIYALVELVKRWKRYLLGKDMTIHIDHQPI